MTTFRTDPIFVVAIDVPLVSARPLRHHLYLSWKIWVRFVGKEAFIRQPFIVYGVAVVSPSAAIRQMELSFGFGQLFHSEITSAPHHPQNLSL